METKEVTVYQQGKDNRHRCAEEKSNPSGRVLAGMVLLGVGGVLLARSLGADIPHWVFSWPMIVLAAGLFAGAKRNFRPDGWIVAVAVGAIFLLMKINPDWDGHNFLWPAIVIGIGLVMILRPKKQH